MRKLLMGLVASTALVAAGAASAHVDVTIYHTDAGAAAAAANATIAQAATMTADATVAVGAINFTDAPGNDSNNFTVGAFLNNPAGLDPTVAAYHLNNTYFLFTGTLFLNAGANAFSVPHDDGLQLHIDGISPNFIVDAPGPTPPVTNNFNVNAPAAGTYNFQLSYGETAGGPAVLFFGINDAPVGGGVPEPATWAMMLAGFGGLGAMMRRRRAMVAA